MQLANIILCLGGLITNTVQKLDVTPAEILVLKHLHGDDAVKDVRPAGFDTRRRPEKEFARLAAIYDAGAGSFTDTPGNEREGVLAKLFPGAMKRLPTTLEEIGIAVATEAPVVVPDVDDPDDEDEPETAEPLDGEADAIAMDAANVDLTIGGEDDTAANEAPAA